MQPSLGSLRRVACAAVALTLGGSALASAAEFCVPSRAIASTCTIAKATPAAAVTSALAAGGSHTIRIGAGTWAGGITVNPAPPATLTVIGAGVSRTKLAGAGSATLVDAAGAVVLRDLTIERTAGASGAELVLASGARGDRLQVIRSAGTSSQTSVSLFGGTLTRSTVRLNSSDAYPLGVSGGAVLDTVTVTGTTATPTSYALTLSNSTARRLKVDFPADLASVYGTGTSLIADSVLIARDPDAAAVSTSASGVLSANMRVADSTLVAPSGSSTAAVQALSYLNGVSASVSASGVATRGFASLGCAGTGNAGATASVDGRASVGPNVSLAECTSSPNTGTENISSGFDLSTADPGFVNFAGGDYRLARTSAAIDTGDPLVPIPAGLPTTDFLGLPRLRDGNLDGSARRDAGAFEYQPPAVTDVRRFGTITKAQLNRSGRLLRVAAGRTPLLGQVRVRVSAVPTRVRFSLAIRATSGAYRTLAGSEELGFTATQRYLSVRGKWMGTVALVRGRTYRLTATTPSSPARRMYFTVR